MTTQAPSPTPTTKAPPEWPPFTIHHGGVISLTRYRQETGQICVLVMQIDMADPLSTRPGGVRFRRY